MKLLLDQNFSHKIATLLKQEYPGSVAAREVGLSRATDKEVWQYALSNGFLIVSKDADFRLRSFVYGAPPKIIWVALGNCSTQQVVDLLRQSVQQVKDFEADHEASLLVLGK